MLLPKSNIIRSKAHRRFIASLPCCMTGVEGQTQCAHIRHNNLGGMGFKPSDSYCVPLSVTAHQRQHGMGSEPKFWGDKLEAAKELANALWLKTGNRDECLKLITRFRRG